MKPQIPTSLDGLNTKRMDHRQTRRPMSDDLFKRLYEPIIK